MYKWWAFFFPLSLWMIRILIQNPRMRMVFIMFCNDTFIQAVIGGCWLWPNVERHLTLWTATLYQEILHDVHGKMPIILQDKSTFSILGQCVPGQSNSSLVAGIEDNKWKLSNCGCLMLDGSSEPNCQASCGKSNWILLTFDSREQNDTRFHRLPKLHHIHWNGLAILQYDVHVCKSWLLPLLAFPKLFI